MVMPKLPFSLFNFKNIDKFAPIVKEIEAAAGVVIPVTTIYKCPDHKFAWLLGVHCQLVKTTGTALRCDHVRPDATVAHSLIVETAGTGSFSWPSGKTTGEHVPGWFPLFMFPGEILSVQQALTALETIYHLWTVDRIEYDDPRYEK